MNNSQIVILILIALLTCFIVNNYKQSHENFSIFASTDSAYAPIGINGIDNPEKAIPINKYANQVAYDLQNTFPNSVTNGNTRVPWNPANYVDVQEPDGQFVGIISPN